MGVLLYAYRVIPDSTVFPNAFKLIFGNNFVNLVMGMRFPSAPVSILNVYFVIFPIGLVLHSISVYILIFIELKCTSWYNNDCTWSAKSSIESFFSSFIS